MSSPIAPELRLYRLIGPPGPPVGLTRRVGEAARAAAIRLQEARTGRRILPDCLHHSPPGAPHRHAHWQPEDRDGDGRIDHLAIRAMGGFDPEARRILDALARIAVTGAGAWRLAPADPGPAPWPAARDWVSATPFFGPNHALDGRGREKRGQGLADQAVRELGLRDWLPPLAGIDWLPARAPDPGCFDLGPRGPGAPALRVAGHLRLSFAAPAGGVVAAGFGAHYGLGRFVPLGPEGGR